MVVPLLHVITIIKTMSGWCSPVVRMDATAFPCMRTCYHDVWTDATLNISNLLDSDGRLDARQGCPDGILGSDFSEVEFAQNLLRHLEQLF
jgi:hypothetical protein